MERKKRERIFQRIYYIFVFRFLPLPTKNKKKSVSSSPSYFFKKKTPLPQFAKKKSQRLKLNFHGPRYYFELTQPFLLSPVKIQEKQLSWTVITILEDTTRLLSGMFSPWSLSLSLNLIKMLSLKLYNFLPVYSFYYFLELKE